MLLTVYLQLRLPHPSEMNKSKFMWRIHTWNDFINTNSTMSTFQLLYLCVNMCVLMVNNHLFYTVLQCMRNEVSEEWLYAYIHNHARSDKVQQSEW